MAKNENLGEGLGAVDMFGLDEFGSPVGANPLYGAVAGALIQGGTSLALKKWTTYDKYADLIGGAAGALAGGAMIAMGENTRAMGWTCLAVALTTGVLKHVEQSLQLSGVSVESLQGLGEVQIEGPGIEQLQLGAGQAPSLVGSEMGGLSAQAEQVRLNGGPNISGLGAHFGTTVFGN